MYLSTLGAAPGYPDKPVYHGTIQPGFNGGLRFSTVGKNFAITGTPDVLDSMRAAMSHCVRIEGDPPADRGPFVVRSWSRLPGDFVFTEGGVTMTCDEFQGKVTTDQTPPPDPNAPTGGGEGSTNTGGGTNTTPTVPGVDGSGQTNGEGTPPVYYPPPPPSSGMMQYLPLAAAAVLLLAMPRRN